MPTGQLPEGSGRSMQRRLTGLAAVHDHTPQPVGFLLARIEWSWHMPAPFA